MLGVKFYVMQGMFEKNKNRIAWNKGYLKVRDSRSIHSRDIA